MEAIADAFLWLLVVCLLTLSALCFRAAIAHFRRDG